MPHCLNSSCFCFCHPKPVSHTKPNLLPGPVPMLPEPFLVSVIVQIHGIPALGIPLHSCSPQGWGAASSLHTRSPQQLPFATVFSLLLSTPPDGHCSSCACQRGWTDDPEQESYSKRTGEESFIKKISSFFLPSSKQGRAFLPFPSPGILPPPSFPLT